MAHYAFKECCYDIDYPKFKELIAKFEQGLGSECDHDANYDGDYWLIAAMWINELRESEKSQAKRIAELEAERDALSKVVWKAKDWLEEEEGRSLDKILENEARYNDKGLIGWNPHYIQLVRLVAAAIKEQQ